MDKHTMTANTRVSMALCG